MADVVTTRSILQSAFADNVLGNISAQAGRNLVVSAFGFIGNASPTVNNDAVDTAGAGAKFDVGSMWFDNFANQIWGCLSGATGAAIWIRLSGGVGGAISSVGRSSTTVFNSGTTITDLWSLPVPGGTLANLNDELRWEAYGNFTSDLNTKFVLCQWGATQILNQSVSGTGNTKWIARGRIIRTGPTTQKIFAELTLQAPSVGYFLLTITGAETLSGSVNFKIQGSSASGSNEVSFVGGFVDKAAA